MAETFVLRCECGQEVTNTTRRCARCRAAMETCACGNPKNIYSKRCRECHLKDSASTARKCKCGKRLYDTKGDTCRTCRDGAYIPMEVVQPLLERLVEERHFLEADGERRGGQSQLWKELDNPQDPTDRFHEKRLNDLLHGRQKVVSYNTVDRILSRTHNFMLWYQEPLCHWFNEPDTCQKPRTSRKCLDCGGDVQRGSVRCRDCYEKLRASRVKYCECGAKLKHKAKRCWDCHVEARKTWRKKHNKTARRLFVKSGT